MTIAGDQLFIEHVERLFMSDCESMSAEVRGRLRSIPAVHELLAYLRRGAVYRQLAYGLRA